jgi:pimeloyl-ACP methyl ester carboxylesterase
MPIATSLRPNANGLSHHVLEWAPEGPRAAAPRTVVLVHGFLDAAGTWDLVAPTLAAAGYRVLAPDMRGFGDGARVPEGSYYHFADYVFDLAELVDALSPGEPIALVGHSMGGMIASLFAGTFPERVAHLVNIEGLGPPDNPFEVGPTRMRGWIEQVRRSRTRAIRPQATFSRDEALARMRANHPNVAPEVLAHRLPHLVADAGGGLVAWHFDPLHRTTSPTPFFVKHFLSFASQVVCPVLFVSGGGCGYHPADEDERLAAFARCHRVELPDAGHMVHWTEPEALARLMLEHFAS